MSISAYESDMDTIVNCAQCYKEIKFGNCYTSLEKLTETGFGYAVCEDCYEREWKRRRCFNND